MRTNALAATPIGPAGGDLFGTFPNKLTTAKLQGVPVSASLPALSQVLTYDGTAWAAATAGGGGGGSVPATIYQQGYTGTPGTNGYYGDLASALTAARTASPSPTVIVDSSKGSPTTVAATSYEMGGVTLLAASGVVTELAVVDGSVFTFAVPIWFIGNALRIRFFTQNVTPINMATGKNLAVVMGGYNSALAAASIPFNQGDYGAELIYDPTANQNTNAFIISTTSVVTFYLGQGAALRPNLAGWAGLGGTYRVWYGPLSYADQFVFTNGTNSAQIVDVIEGDPSANLTNILNVTFPSGPSQFFTPYAVLPTVASGALTAFIATGTYGIQPGTSATPSTLLTIGTPQGNAGRVRSAALAWICTSTVITWTPHAYVNGVSVWTGPTTTLTTGASQHRTSFLFAPLAFNAGDVVVPGGVMAGAGTPANVTQLQESLAS